MESKQPVLNHRKYKTLVLNGTRLEGGEICDFCASGPAYMREIGAFAEAWLNESEFLEVQTSGSTGVPSRLMVRKNHMLQSARLTERFFGFKAGMTALLALPAHYIAGKMMVVRAFLSGLNLICAKPSRDVLQQVDQNTIDFAPLVPMQLQGYANSSIKQILLGGAPLSAGLEEHLRHFSNMVYQGYGMTETLSHAALRRINGPMPEGAYRALPGVELNVDSGNRLHIKMPWMQEAIVTNDIVEMLSAETFVWRGRADFVINSGGVKLFPEEIERKIGDIGSRFFIWPKEDAILGQTVMLVVEGNKRDLSGSFSGLHPYEIPRKVLFVKRFAETSSQKINRPQTIKDAQLFFDNEG